MERQRASAEMANRRGQRVIARLDAHAVERGSAIPDRVESGDAENFPAVRVGDVERQAAVGEAPLARIHPVALERRWSDVDLVPIHDVRDQFHGLVERLGKDGPALALPTFQVSLSLMSPLRNMQPIMMPRRCSRCCALRERRHDCGSGRNTRAGAHQAVDFRRGADSLVALVGEQLGHDPFSGAIFIFRAGGPAENHGPGLEHFRDWRFLETPCFSASAVVANRTICELLHFCNNRVLFKRGHTWGLGPVFS